MEKKYLVKDFETQAYYCGEAYGWAKEPYLVYYFDSVEDAAFTPPHPAPTPHKLKTCIYAVNFYQKHLI